VWDFSFFAWRSDFFVAAEVLVAEAGGGEDASERLELGGVGVAAASSVLIFLFNGWVSVALGARLRVVLVAFVFEVSSCLIFADRGSCLAVLCGASALELRVLFFFAGVRASSLFAAEARVAARGIGALDKFRQWSLVNDKIPKVAPKEQGSL
jgi:hypothetical protein